MTINAAIDMIKTMIKLKKLTYFNGFDCFFSTISFFKSFFLKFSFLIESNFFSKLFSRKSSSLIDNNSLSIFTLEESLFPLDPDSSLSFVLSLFIILLIFFFYDAKHGHNYHTATTYHFQELN